jgi:hypothetical protein
MTKVPKTVARTSNSSENLEHNVTEGLHYIHLSFRNKLQCLQLSVISTLVLHEREQLGAYHWSRFQYRAPLWYAPALPANNRLG